MRFIRTKAAFSINDAECLSKCIELIETELTRAKVDKRLLIKAELLSEEMIASLIQNNASMGGDITVRIKKIIGDISITISAAGEEFDISEGSRELTEDLGDEEAQNAIRSIILRSQADSVKYSHKKGVNSVRIMTGQGEISMVHLTIGALVLGALFGLMIKFLLPGAATAVICDYALTPVKTIFLNAIRIVIAPVVFFSIVTCVSSFGDISELGRIGARVMSLYLITTTLAVIMSIGVSRVLSPGRFGAGLGMAAEAVEVDTNVDTSLLTTLINIVPSNFLRPFLESDTLQVIFLAMIVGIAVGRIGEYTPVLSELFEACNSLFLTITSMIARFIPAAVFCSVALMLVNLGLDSVLSVAGWFGTQVLAIGCMLVIYGMLVFVLGRCNPVIFFRKAREGMLTALTLCSSSATIPTSMRVCTDKLGVNPKVCSFSIPLGATINMDGTCVYLTITGLFLAKMYAITVTPSMLVSLMVTIVLLSLGCPGVPGSGIVCLGITLAHLGVPIEAIGLVIALNPFTDMVDTMSNVTGDIACALIAARREGLLDDEIYKDMSRI